MKEYISNKMLATPKYKIQTIREFKTFVVISLNTGRKMQKQGKILSRFWHKSNRFEANLDQNGA